MALTKPDASSGSMEIDFPGNMKVSGSSHRQDSPDSLPDYESDDNGLQMKFNARSSNHSRITSTYNEYHRNGIYFDKSVEDDGGVSLVPAPHSSPYASASSPMGVSLNYDDDIDMSAFIPSSSCTKASSTGLGLHLDTDPPPPYSESTTPINYARSALEMIREEPHGHDGMDFDFDDDEMPALEDTSLNLPSLPGSFPNFSKPFRKPSPSSAPNEGLPLPARPSNPTIKEEDTKQDDDARSFFSTSLSKDEPSRAPSNIHTSWDSSIWPPENPDEKSFCKRICSQVALFHGFKKVVIKSGIITMNTERLGTCVRHIYVEPHIVATFYVNPATQAERHKSKYYLRDSKKVERERGETVEIHVGREGWDIDDNLEEWGLWRKGGKEVLHWYAEWEEEYCG